MSSVPAVPFVAFFEQEQYCFWFKYSFSDARQPDACPCQCEADSFFATLSHLSQFSHKLMIIFKRRI